MSSGKFKTGQLKGHGPGNATKATARGPLASAVPGAPDAVGRVMGSDESTAGSLFPQSWLKRNAALEEARLHVELGQMDKDDRGKLVGPSGILGHKDWQQHIIDSAKDAHEEIAEARFKQFAVGHLADYNTLEGKKYLDELMPGIDDEKSKLAKLALHQLEFLMDLGRRTRFNDVDEMKRIVWILGAGEPLIGVLHPALTRLFDKPNSLHLMQDDDDQYMGYFMPWDRFNPWFRKRDRHRATRQKIAETVIQLFPKLLTGYTNPLDGGGAGVKQSVLGTAVGANIAHKLVKNCEMMVYRATQGEFLGQFLDNVRPGAEKPIGNFFLRAAAAGVDPGF